MMTSQYLRSGRRLAIYSLALFGFTLVMAAVSSGFFRAVWIILALVLTWAFARQLRACARCGVRSLTCRFFFVSVPRNCDRTRVCIDCLTEPELDSWLTR